MTPRLKTVLIGWRDALLLIATLFLLQGALDPAHAASSQRVVERTMQNQTATSSKQSRRTTKNKPGQYTGQDVVEMRKKRDLNQHQFWSPLGVTQSGGSRYETGRNIPRTVRKLLWVMYESPLALAAQTDNVVVHADILLQKLEAI